MEPDIYVQIKVHYAEYTIDGKKVGEALFVVAGDTVIETLYWSLN